MKFMRAFLPRRKNARRERVSSDRKVGLKSWLYAGNSAHTRVPKGNNLSSMRTISREELIQGDHMNVTHVSVPGAKHLQGVNLSEEVQRFLSLKAEEYG